MELVILSADDSLEAERYLMFQRAREWSDEDQRLGMADVYVETCGQGWSWYGHIASVELRNNRIEVLLDEHAASRMRDTGEILVGFELSPTQFAELREAMRRIFRDRAYFRDLAA